MGDLSFLNRYAEIKKKFAPVPQVIHRINHNTLVEEKKVERAKVVSRKENLKKRAARWLKPDSNGVLRDFIFLTGKKVIDEYNTSYTPDGPRKARAILQEVADQNDVTVAAICSPARQQYLSLVRRVVCYRLRTELRWSYPRIGAFINKDHSTVIHAVRMYEKELEDEKNRDDQENATDRP